VNLSASRSQIRCRHVVDIRRCRGMRDSKLCTSEQSSVLKLAEKVRMDYASGNWNAWDPSAMKEVIGKSWT
jgi:hypothetical protein